MLARFLLFAFLSCVPVNAQPIGVAPEFFARAPAGGGSIVVTDLGTASHGSGTTLTKSITVPSGAAVVVCVEELTSTAGTMSDATNGAYTLATSKSDTGGITEAFYFLNSASLSSITLTYTASNSSVAATLSALYATGVATSSALDGAVTATVTSGATAPPTISLTSGTPAQSGELFVACTGGRSGTGTLTLNEDTGNGWAFPPDQVQFSASSSWVAGGSQVNAGSGTKAYAPTISNWGSQSRQASTLIIGFKHP